MDKIYEGIDRQTNRLHASALESKKVCITLFFIVNKKTPMHFLEYIW